MKRAFKRTFTLLLCLVLLAGLALPALAADTAVSLVLEKTEGTVTVTDAAGLELTLDDGAVLHSGYTVSTAAASYAWLTLGDGSLLKLDGLSRVTILISERRLRLQLDAGSLYFDLSQFPEGDDPLELGVSGMSADIRGTTGIASLNRGVPREPESELVKTMALPPAIEPSDQGRIFGLPPAFNPLSGNASTQLILLDGNVDVNISPSVGPGIVGGGQSLQVVAGQTMLVGLQGGAGMTGTILPAGSLGQGLSQNPFASLEVSQNTVLTSDLLELGVDSSVLDPESIQNALSWQQKLDIQRQAEAEALGVSTTGDTNQFFAQKPEPETEGDPRPPDPTDTTPDPDQDLPDESDTSPPDIIGGGPNSGGHHRVTYYYPKITWVGDDDKVFNLQWKTFGTYSFSGPNAVPKPWLEPALFGWEIQDGYWTDNGGGAGAACYYVTVGQDKPTPPVEYDFDPELPITNNLDLYWCPDIRNIPNDNP